MKKSVLLPYERYQRLMMAVKQKETAECVPDTDGSLEEHVPEDSFSQCAVKTTEIENSPTSLLLQHFPKTMQNRVQSLLAYIKPHVSWNDRGEVTIEGKLLLGSNIVDLIKVHIKDYKHFQPVGKEAFGQLLSKINVPTSLLSPSARQQSGGNIPPPPGIAIKRKITEDSAQPSKKIRWLHL